MIVRHHRRERDGGGRMLLDNQAIIGELLHSKEKIEGYLKNNLVKEQFYKDFGYRFCWNSNAVEGNTLTLDETVAVVDFDEVRSGHTYAEYTEAKNLYQAIQKMMDTNGTEITEEWILEANRRVLGADMGVYRQINLYVGTLFEATYYPPAFQKIPALMENYVASLGHIKAGRTELEQIAEEHILFERIHPFIDGNGRTGRMLLNQRLINSGFLPVLVVDQAKYRQAFCRYDQNQDFSLMAYLLCKGEQESMERAGRMMEGVQGS